MAVGHGASSVQRSEMGNFRTKSLILRGSVLVAPLQMLTANHDLMEAPDGDIWKAHFDNFCIFLNLNGSGTEQAALESLNLSWFDQNLG